MASRATNEMHTKFLIDLPVGTFEATLDKSMTTSVRIMIPLVSWIRACGSIMSQMVPGMPVELNPSIVMNMPVKNTKSVYDT